MINFIAMAAIIAAIFLSNDRRSIPAIMLAYYVVVIASMYVMLGTVDSSQPIKLSAQGAVNWYITSIAIDVLFIVAISISCAVERLSKLYCLLIGYVVLIKIFGIFYGDVRNEWFSDVYEFCKSFVVELEIIIAWLASDNAVSRKFYRLRDTACQSIKSGL